MKSWIALLILFSFIGCTTPNMIMKSWVGHREEDLYRQWGPPSKVIDKGRDGKIAMYIPDGRPRYTNAGKPVESITQRNNEYKRTKSFFITPMGNIYAWKWD